MRKIRASIHGTVHPTKRSKKADQHSRQEPATSGGEQLTRAQVLGSNDGAMPPDAPKRGRGRPRKDLDRDEVVRLRRKGLSWRAIARICGAGVTTVVEAYGTAPTSPTAPRAYEKSGTASPGDQVREREAAKKDGESDKGRGDSDGEK